MKNLTLIFLLAWSFTFGQTKQFPYNAEYSGFVSVNDSFIITLPDNGYTFRERTGVGERLSIQSTTSGKQSVVNIFAKDGDGTDNVGWTLFGVGNSYSSVNTESFRAAYIANATDTCYHLGATQTGTGGYRAILISSDSSINSIQLNPSSDIEIKGGVRFLDTIQAGVWNGSEIDTATVSRDALSFTGSVNASQVVDFQDSVSVNSDVVANTAKVSNATHTGDVTGSVALTIAAKAVDVAMLADGTDGELITWDATGVAATVATGTATHVLTSNGIGTAPTFQAAGGGAPTKFTITSETASTISSTTRSFLGTSGSHFLSYAGTGISNEESGWTFVVPQNWTSGMRIDLYGVTAATTDSLGFEMTVTISTVGETRSTTTQTLAFKNTVGSAVSWNLWTIQDYIITSTLAVGDVVTLKINRPAQNAGDTYGADGFMEFITGEYNY